MTLHPNFEWHPTTLEEAKQWLRDHLDDGANCPCCTQRAQIYRRKISDTMAGKLIGAYRRHRLGYFHLPTLIAELGIRGRDESHLAYWELLEEERAHRPDGGRSGWWRVTPAGEQFIRGVTTVPMYARVYDGRCLSLTGDPVSIRDALGTRFDYTDLMGGI